jgi:diacylglycerol kinase (ATP)
MNVIVNIIIGQSITRLHRGVKQGQSAKIVKIRYSLTAFGPLPVKAYNSAVDSNNFSTQACAERSRSRHEESEDIKEQTMRVKVILNPWSDRGRAAKLEQQIPVWARQAGGELDLVLTERPGHAKQLAREATLAGYDLVVAAGGDGTVHEVVNGLVQGGQATATLGVIPVGSGNDFAFSQGITTNPEAAVQRLFSGQPVTIDLARVEDEHGRFALFDNNLGIGFDAIVVIQTEAITRVHGFLMYFLAVLRTIALYYQTPHLTLDFDNERVAQEVLFLAMGMGRRGGGGFLLTPDARHDDDLVDSCTVDPIGRLRMLGMLGKAIRGTHIHAPFVTMRKSRRIVAQANQPLPIHIDGEIFAYPRDNVRQITVTSLPQALQIMR